MDAGIGSTIYFYQTPYPYLLLVFLMTIRSLWRVHIIYSTEKEAVRGKMVTAPVSLLCHIIFLLWGKQKFFQHIFSMVCYVYLTFIVFTVEASKVEWRLEWRLQASRHRSWVSQPTLPVKLLQELERVRGKVTFVPGGKTVWLEKYKIVYCSKAK